MPVLRISNLKDAQIKSFFTGLAPQEMTNWELVEEDSFTNEVVDWSLVGLDGNTSERFRIEVQGDLAQNLYLRLNDDSNSANYKIGRHYFGKANGLDYHQGDGNVSNSGLLLMEGLVGANCEVILWTKTGKPRQAQSKGSFYISDSQYRDCEYISVWTNTTSLVNKMTLVSSGNFTGTIRIFKESILKPASLFTYEVVKEYNLNNQMLDELFDIDGELDSTLYVVTKLSSVPNSIKLYFNDDQANNYTVIWNYASGTTGVHSSGVTAGVSLGYNGLGHSIVSLKSGMTRGALTNYFQNTSASPNAGQANFVWSDTVNPITKIRIKSQAAVTGKIEIYKLAKSYLVSQQPNVLTTWFKSIDNNTVELQPGEIELSGTICNVTKVTQIPLSSSLRTGESEKASTMYYLYAIRSQGGRNVTFKFSEVAPTVDRYGNIVASILDVDPKRYWYHPSEGANWRYIGQIFNDASSNIIPFDKHYPGYWESAFKAIGTTNMHFDEYHALGKVVTKLSVMCKRNLNDTLATPAKWWHSSSTASYGFLMHTGANSTLYKFSMFFSAITNGGGLFYEHATGLWYSTGYYKIIVEA